MLVKDNGVGFDTTKQYYTSLGMMLIQRLVTKQLNGTIDISCDNGAKMFKYKVLIVEDEAIVAFDIESALHHMGYSVCESVSYHIVMIFQ